ncbi:MAG: putative lipid II flippase FtsW [Candidatus Wildermuthbacteria bacterium]|nr:putative lipid II flippase FtsW [Candidatus Wildermuthbacteria bacterium]
MVKKRLNFTADPWLFGICGTLVFLGVIMLASVSASFSLERYGTTFYFLNHQILFGLLPGLLLGGILFFLPRETIRALSIPAFLFSLFLCLMVFIPFVGIEAGGAHRWIHVGGFTFQPSELLKLGFILYLAAWLSAKIKKSKKKPEPDSAKTKNLATSFLTAGDGSLVSFLLIMGGIGAILIAQPDVGTLGVIWIIGGIMYFTAHTPLWHTITLALAALGSLISLIHIAPYRLSRLAVFLDPSLDPLGQGYHVKQALIGIGSGGIVGAGLGLSAQKFGLLPEPMSDSIFAVIAEETGFIGACFLVLLFAALCWRVMVLAQRMEDRFAKIACIGIVSWLCVQAFINMGAITGILPLTGIPLPFVSYGGSALLTEILGLGILLNLTKR